jgi:VWFA-related protein
MQIPRSTILSMAGVAGVAAGPGQDVNTARQAPTERQQAAPTFRSAVQLVEVDVIATDRDGRFVEGLGPGDLEIYENGERQQIAAFYLVDGRRVFSDLDEDTRTPASGRQPPRVFVFVFDEGHLRNEAVQRLKRAAEAFITSELRPTDVAGVFHGGRMANGRITSSKTELLASIRAVEPAHDTRATRLASFREFPRVNGEHEAARIEAGDSRTLSNAAQQNCQEDPDQCRQEGGTDMVERQLEHKARQYIDEARAATSRVLRTLTVVASGLGRIPGRKTLVFLTEGFFVDEARTAVQQIAALAARNGVTIYCVDGRGTIATGGRELPDASMDGAPISTSFDTAEGGPAILAANTGGFVIRGSDNFTRAFNLIAQDTTTYYVLGYAPDTQKLDGSLRKIEVRSNVPGVDVRARKGYLATPLPPSAVRK